METETNKRPARKVVILIIFFVLLVLIAWLSITIVRSVPGSFASLASLAESVRTFDTSNLELTGDDEATQNPILDEMLVVTSDTNVAETDGEVRLTWTDTRATGSFVFNYECTPGVAMAIVEPNGVREVGCDTNYNIGNRNNLVLTVSSEQERYVDVPYSIGFVTDEATGPQALDGAMLTIVNEDIPLSLNGSVAIEDGVGESQSETATPEVETESEPAPESPVAASEPEPAVESASPAPTTPAGEPFTQEYTYTIPVSDPNGRVDLATRFVAAGSVIDNTFVADTTAPGSPQAIQFEVKNLGTKTSGNWSYELELPTGGLVDSDAQAPLRPNERALITIGFPTGEVTEFDFLVSIDTTEDTTALNNQFIQTVTFE